MTQKLRTIQNVAFKKRFKAQSSQNFIRNKQAFDDANVIINQFLL
jgi:hypothetical protein